MTALVLWQLIRYKAWSQHYLMKVLDAVVIPEVSSPNCLFKQWEGDGRGAEDEGDTWEFCDLNYPKVNSIMKDKAFSIQAYCATALLALWIHFLYCCLTNQETRLSHLCHIQASNIHHLLFGTANRADKPSHPPFSHVQHLPHTCTRTLLDRSTPSPRQRDTLPSLSCSQGK